MEINDSVKYLSLKNAAQLYGYTRDHLGLMIRQNKLKGKKLGNYYITTNEWVLEYVKNYADPNHSTAKNKLSNRFISEALSSKKEIKSFEKRKNFPQKNTSCLEEIKKPASFINGKSDDSSGEPKTKLQEEILKELLLSQEDKALNIESKSRSDTKEEMSWPPSNQPYLVLPIRKMEDIERERILNSLDCGGKEVESA